MSFQEQFWLQTFGLSKDALSFQPYDTEVGGWDTPPSNHIVFFRSKLWRAAYAQP